MPFARFRKRCGALGAAMMIAACAGRDITTATSPIDGASAHRASYAFNTEYGEMYEENGELMPAGYSQPWNAVIIDKKTSASFASSCSVSRCDVTFTAWMLGLWHTTRQTISWSVGGASGNPSIVSSGWQCALRFGALNCALAERTNTHSTRVDGKCELHATVSGTHEAWWGAWFDLTLFEIKFSQVGNTSTHSVGEEKDWGSCGSSGGGEGPNGCWVYILYWWDDYGQYQEAVIGTLCYGEDAT